jgi:hypothetical protein
MPIKPEAVVLATAGLVLVAGGLLATAGLASFVHWRGEATQQVAMAAQSRAAQARQSIAWETPTEFRRLAPTPRTEQVLFMPAVVAER